VAPLLPPQLDRYLLLQPERHQHPVEQGRVATGVEKGAQHHVARDAREAVEV